MESDNCRSMLWTENTLCERAARRKRGAGLSEGSGEDCEGEECRDRSVYQETPDFCWVQGQGVRDSVFGERIVAAGRLPGRRLALWATWGWTSLVGAGLLSAPGLQAKRRAQCTTRDTVEKWREARLGMSEDERANEIFTERRARTTNETYFKIGTTRQTAVEASCVQILSHVFLGNRRPPHTSIPPRQAPRRTGPVLTPLGPGLGHAFCGAT
jgi:hypothetical protein